MDERGSFYLGRYYDLAAGRALPEPLLYQCADLTTHAVCVGMTGSGKTGLCLALLEEAALNGIPAIAIDPKGDLGNLLLAFPELRPEDFRPWIDEAAAARQGRTPDEQAALTAEQWRQGLGAWSQDGERIRRFTESADRAIYTPGSSAGLSLAILRSLAAPSATVLDDQEAMGDRIAGVAAGLLGLLGIEADPMSREHILLARVLEESWRAGRDLDLTAMIHAIQQPTFERVGVVDLETFFPAAERLELAMRVNNLLASPSFAGWLAGEPLDVERLLYAADRRPRLSIISIAHLDEPQRMFFVTLLLGEVIAWMRAQPGSSSLRAILYMDEAYGYLPPTANPPSKRPMLTLLKQARAYGLGCVLATQNPVDLDYKALSNAGTWLLGRLQTERDKLRVIEGLEGASAEAGAAFDRQKTEAVLAALDNRVFLLNNVHAPSPAIFQARWAMSYLAGPLTRRQISALMAPRKLEDENRPPSAATAPDAASQRSSEDAHRPVLSPDIPQRYLGVDPDTPPAPGEQLTYRPALLAAGKLHFVKASHDIDLWQEYAALQPVYGALTPPVWASAMVFQRAPRTVAEPAPGARFADLPPELVQPKNYRRWDDDLADHLYQTQRLVLLQSDDPRDISRPEETEPQFRARLLEQARQENEANRSAIQRQFAERIQRQEQRVASAQSKVAQEKSQFWTRLGGLVGRAAEASVRAILGRKSRTRIITATTAGAAIRQRQQQSQAQSRLAEEEAKLAALQAQEQEELSRADDRLRLDWFKLSQVELPPRKSDIGVDAVALAWVPWWINGAGKARPAY
ncbi:MAG: ATP-binding protein [Pirellulales bacterium]|nr:ATP-binding protein [Pirellulales bacterium]